MKPPLKPGQFVLLPFAGPKWQNLFKLVREEKAFGPNQWSIHHPWEKRSRDCVAYLTPKDRVRPSYAKRVEDAYRRDIQQRVGRARSTISY